MKNYLLFILSVWIIGPHLHAQTLQGRILFEDNPKKSPGQCQVEFAGMPEIQSTRKGVFILDKGNVDSTQLLKIDGISSQDEKLQVINFRDVQYLSADKWGQENPIIVYVLSTEHFDARKKRIEKCVDEHVPLVLERLYTEFMMVDRAEAMELSKMLTAGFPQMKTLLINNLCLTVTSRLSEEGRRVFAMMGQADTDISAGVSALQAFVQSGKANSEDILLLARLLMMEFHLNASAETYISLLNQDPDNLGLIVEFKELAITIDQPELMMPFLTSAINGVEDKRFLAYNLNDLAAVYQEREDYPRAAIEARRALNYLYELEKENPWDYNLLIVAVTFNLANTYKLMETEDEKAIALFDTLLYRNAQNPDLGSNNTLMKSTFMANMLGGDVRTRLNSEKEAYPYFDRMFSMYREDPQLADGLPRESLFGAYLDYCEGKELLGYEGEELTTCYEQSISFLEGPFNREEGSLQRMLLYHRIAKIQEKAGEYEQALLYYKKAIEALDQSPTGKNNLYSWELNNCLGQLLGEYGRYNESMKFFNQAISKANMLTADSVGQSDEYLGKTWSSIGEVHRVRLLGDSALYAFTKALNYFMRIENPTEEIEAMIANTYNHTGAIWAEQKSNPPQAEVNFGQALHLYMQLADKDPGQYNLRVAMCAHNLLGIRAQHLDTIDRRTSLELIDQTLIRLNYPGLNPDEAKSYKENMVSYKAVFSGQLKAFESAVMALSPLLNQRKLMEGNSGKSHIQQQIVNQLEKAVELSPAASKARLQTMAAQESGNLAWYAIFDHQFEMAEKSARHALVLDPNQVWVNTNLAHALLLQGKTDEGMNVYLQFRDQLTSDGRPFRGIFLNDIAEMEKAGIICAGFDEVEKLLRD